MYADSMTDSMKICIEETNRRRSIQMKYNEEHGIKPTTIKKAVRELIAVSRAIESTKITLEKDPESMSEDELDALIAKTEKQMRKAAAELDFENAAELRDSLVQLKKYRDGSTDSYKERPKKRTRRTRQEKHS